MKSIRGFYPAVSPSETKEMRYLVALFLSLSTLPLSAAKAALVLNVVQSGSNVVATASGSLDIRGLTLAPSSSGNASVSAARGIITVGFTSTIPWNNFKGMSGPTAFGTGINVPASSGNGGRLGINRTSLAMPIGYESGSAIVSRSTWNNTTISALGLTPGTYSWTWSRDTVTMNVTVVPEPSSLVLLGLSAAGMVAVRRWQRYKNVRSPS